MATRAKLLPMTDREASGMEVLWDEGPSTVREALDHFPDGTPYTSVLSIYQTLEEKGLVGHERDGAQYIYHAIVTRDDARDRALRAVADRHFGGDPRALIRFCRRDLGRS